MHPSVRGNGEGGPSAHGAGHEDRGTELMGGGRQASEQRTHKSRQLSGGTFEPSHHKVQPKVSIKKH